MYLDTYNANLCNMTAQSDLNLGTGRIAGNERIFDGEDLVRHA